MSTKASEVSEIKSVPPATEAGILNFEPTEYKNIRTPHGFFDYDDIYRAIMDDAKDGDTIVEIGSWVGRSTLYMAELVKYASEKLNKRVRFVNVEPFLADVVIHADGSYGWVESTEGEKPKTRAEFYKNTEAFREFIETIEEKSVPAASKFKDGSIFAVWVDARHDYNSVMEDLRAWFPKVKKGGIIAGHDFTYDFGGVPKAVHDFCIENVLQYTVNHKSFVIYK